MCNEREENINTSNMCDTDKCVPFEKVIKVEKLARAYVPFQKLCSVYDLFDGFVAGTVFPELNQPYCKRKKNYDKCSCEAEN